MSAYDYAKINKLLKEGFLQIGDLLDIGLVSGFENFESKLSPNSTCEEAIRILIRYTRERGERQTERLLNWIKGQRPELWKKYQPYKLNELNNTGTIKLLFLPINQSEQSPLDLPREYGMVQKILGNDSIHLAGLLGYDRLKDDFDVFSPNLVHICGHGDAKTDFEVGKNFVKWSALGDLLSLNNVRCVVLNFCYAESHVSELLHYVPWVVSIAQEKANDDAAIRFAEAFYQEIKKEPWNIQTAFKHGCAAVGMTNHSTSVEPKLFERDKEPISCERR